MTPTTDPTEGLAALIAKIKTRWEARFKVVTSTLERCDSAKAYEIQNFLADLTQLTALAARVARSAQLVISVIQSRRAQHTEALKGWQEPDGFLVVTEPDADERRRIRDCLYAALTELSLVEKALHRTDPPRQEPQP